MPEQGAMMKCFLCFEVNQQLDSNCPECHGSGEYFQTAQLMDRKSSDKLILGLLNTIIHQLQADLTVQKQEIYHILKMIKLYNFNLWNAFIEIYRELDENEELG